MQTSITKISMKINDENDSIKAYASVVFNHSVKINGTQRYLSDRYQWHENTYTGVPRFRRHIRLKPGRPVEATGFVSLKGSAV